VTQRRRAMAALLALLGAQLLANALILAVRANELNHLPHHYLIGAVEMARGSAPVEPPQVKTGGLFYAFPVFLTRVLGLSLFSLKFSTTFYWLGALLLLAMVGWWLAGPRVGWLAALALSAMAFANNFSRAFDVHVPRLMWEAVVLAGLAAYWRSRKWYALPLAAAGLIGGVRTNPGVSDGLLFLLGAAPAGYLILLHLVELAREGRRARFWLTLPPALLAAVNLLKRWVLYNPQVNFDYVTTEAGRSLGGATDLLSQALAYPAFLAATALGIPASLLFLGSLIPALRAKGWAGRVWLIGLLIPLLVLTWMPKKNGYYLAVTLPYLALGIGIGLDRIVKKHRLAWVLILAPALAGNLLSWMRAQPIIDLGTLNAAFQSPPTDGYQAAPLKPLSLARQTRLKELAGRTCGKDKNCRIAWIGAAPDELDIFLETALAQPCAVLVKVLNPIIEPPVPGSFALAVLYTGAFAADEDTDSPTLFPVSSAMDDPVRVAAEVQRLILENRLVERYPDAEMRIARALTGLRYLGRYEGLDYYVAGRENFLADDR